MNKTSFIRSLGVQDFFVLVAFWSLLVIQMPEFANDPGVGWHLATGLFITSYKSIPHFDPFTATQPALPWISDQWLSDVALYLLYLAGSWPLLYATITVIFISTFFLALYLPARKITSQALLTTLVILITFKLAQIHFILRPVVFAFPCFALVCARCFYFFHHLRNSTSAPTAKQLAKKDIFLVVLFALWANLHPSFSLGLFVLGLVPIALTLEVLFSARSWPLRSTPLHNNSHPQNISLRLIVYSLALVAICGVATLLNPYGFRLHESILLLGKSDYFMRLNMEWRPPNFANYEGQLVLLCLGLMGAGILFGQCLKKSWGWFEILITLAFSFAALRAMRMLPFFSIAVTIPLIQATYALLTNSSTLHLPAVQYLKRRFSWLETREKQTYGGILGVLLICPYLLWSALANQTLPLYQGNWGPEPKNYPYAALQKILSDSKESTLPTIVLNTADWGGFLIWWGKGKLLPVIDDRNTMFGEDAYRSNLGALAAGDSRGSATDWRAYAKKFNVRYLLLMRGLPLGEALRTEPGLTLLHEDGISFLYRVENL